jgi:histidinol phosphatase-like PHP family hydrolase
LPSWLARLADADVNARAAALLYEMAALQKTERSQFGYKRAAKALVALPVSVADLVEAGTLRDVPYVGPASARIVTEFIEEGASPTLDAALAASGQAAQVTARRAYRGGFLSHYVMQRALEAKLPAAIVSRAAYRGDFQMHSTYSDGAERVATMAAACVELGHSCLGLTDHSHGLAIAGGMSMAAAARQGAEIDRLNAKYGGAFRIFKGIEANILADGTLDLTRDERRAFEFVVASPHSLLRRTEDQTARMVGAVTTPGVAILGHPRGRMYNSRPGVSADWDAVFDAAARREVAIELDGNWHRQDVDYVLAARALAAGCIFALDSDAHSIAELRFSEYAVAHARLALVPADRVINCWNNERLEEWMRRRRQPASP